MTLTAEDRLDIMDLYARNAWALDVADAETFVATFTRDASLQMRDRYDGSEGIRKFVDLFRERDVGFPRAQHFVSQVVIEGDGDVCSGRSYVSRVHRLPGQHRSNSHIMWSGYTLDSCIKVSGSWLFQARSFRAWEGDVAAAVNDARPAAAGDTGRP